jgi:hypothetical protein
MNSENAEASPADDLVAALSGSQSRPAPRHYVVRGFHGERAYSVRAAAKSKAAKSNVLRL